MPSRPLLLLAAAAGLALLAWSTGAWQIASGEGLQHFFRDRGALGPVLYVLLFSLLQPFGVLGVLFILAGSFVWDPWTLFLLSWLGAIGAGIVGFGFARSFGRGFAERHLPASARRFDERLARNALVGVLLVRLVSGLWQPAHFLLGLSKVGFAPFVVGSALGFVPQVAFLTWTGKGTVDWLEAQPVGTLEYAAALAALGGAAFLLIRRRGAREAASSGPPGAAATDRSEP